MPIIDNVTFFYAKIKQPALKFGSKTEKVWEVDVQVSKTQAKAHNKQFPKQKAKEYTAEEFEKAFGIPPAETNDDDEYFVLKLKRDTKYPSGDDIPTEKAPKVYIKGSTGKLKDVTQTKLVGNGSKGTAEYFITTSDEYGTFAKLKAILVTDLVEYAGAASGTELGDVEDDAEAAGSSLGEVEAEAPAVSKVTDGVKPKQKVKKTTEAPMTASDDSAGPF